MGLTHSLKSFNLFLLLNINLLEIPSPTYLLKIPSPTPCHKSLQRHHTESEMNLPELGAHVLAQVTEEGRDIEKTVFQKLQQKGHTFHQTHRSEKGNNILGLIGRGVRRRRDPVHTRKDSACGRLRSGQSSVVPRCRPYRRARTWRLEEQRRLSRR
jgi:hypothetical protein